ncbi:MAG: hypothetical protein JSW52_03040 [Candidatus Coatesbacteria bacterium]|nr:MAG: hypothetical protein JSW52_03040 [Candidatus Coatesbacteria bacterium]
MRSSLWFIYISVAASVLYVSCGDGGTSPGVGDEGYFPNKEGSTWTYEVTDSNIRETWNETRTVKGTRDVYGVVCQIIESTYSDAEGELDRTFIKDDEKNQVDIWGTERAVDGSVEDTFYFEVGVPWLKYPCTVGSSWHVYSAKGLKPTEIPFAGFEDDDLDDDGIPDSADVTVNADVIVQEDVSVRAGVFSDCFKVVYTFDFVVYCSEWGDWPMGATSYQWFKPYVGFVRSYTVIDLPTPLPDSEVMEELLSYDLPS